MAWVPWVLEGLEEAGFVFASPSPDPVDAGLDWIGARVRFDGPRRGYFALLCTVDLSVALAGNMSGEPLGADQSTGASTEAVAEMANILAGMVLDQVLGGDDYDLGLPERLSEGSDAWRGFVGASVVNLETDDGDVLVVALALEAGVS